MSVLGIVRCVCIVLAASIAANTGASRAASGSEQTRVVILGVDHSAELVSRAFGPGVVTAFIHEVAPAAICIERPPQQAARGDYYEFTYEVQGIVLPYAAAHATPICPIDWMPAVSDQKLVFGSDLDVPPEIRPASGYQSFLTFPRDALNEGLFTFDDPAAVAPVVQWSAKVPTRMDHDFPRRLYLYRTYMQAENILAAARAYPGKTILVVVGYFHKPDLQAILSRAPQVEIVQASFWKAPDDAAAGKATTLEQRVAILSFNLLGLQSVSGIVDWNWITDNLHALAAIDGSPEVALFEIRYKQLRGMLRGQALAGAYEKLVRETPVGARFIWTGVKDPTRVDSYFDPFGNLTVRQRALLEYSRALYGLGQTAAATRAFQSLVRDLQRRQAWQLDAYASTYIFTRYVPLPEPK